MNRAYLIGSLVFGVVAFTHMMRLFYPTEILIGDWNVPQWVSLVVFLVAGSLSGWLLRGATRGK